MFKNIRYMATIVETLEMSTMYLLKKEQPDTRLSLKEQSDTQVFIEIKSKEEELPKLVIVDEEDINWTLFQELIEIEDGPKTIQN